MTAAKEALQAELIAAARSLLEAEGKAHVTAFRCEDCGRPHTARITTAKQDVIYRARRLAEYLAQEKPA